MAAKRHHSSKKQTMLDRYHEHAGMEREMHGYRPDAMGYISKHERNMHNDKSRNDQMPERSGPYYYDRQGMDEHRIRERSSGKMSMYNDPYYGNEMKNDRRDGRMYDGFYEGYEGRRRQEMVDAGMIHEDHRQVANLPQDVKMTMYPKTGPRTPEEIDDTIIGVDRQINFDNSQKMRHFFPKKV